jgi:hypothetical protein
MTEPLPAPCGLSGRPRTSVRGESPLRIVQDQACRVRVFFGCLFQSELEYTLPGHTKM